HFGTRSARCPQNAARGKARRTGGAQRPREGAGRVARRAVDGAIAGGQVRIWVILLALLVACGEKEKESGPQYTVEQHSIVVFAPNSPQIASLTSVPIEPRRDMVLRFNGRLVWNEDRTVRVFAPFAGRVTEIAVRPGDRVKAGQKLAVLAAPEL